MDISGGSVPPGPNLNGGMKPLGWIKTFLTEYKKSKYVRISLRTFDIFYSSFKNAL